MAWMIKTSALVLCLAAGTAAVAEHRGFEASRQHAMGVVDPTTVTLTPAPIRPEWIIDGTPTTTAAEIAHTDDETTRVFVWRTSAARFHWNYEFDEVVQILDGEVFVADETHAERRLGAGDVVFFPFGARTVWRVPDHVRKIATIRRGPPSPVADALRWLRGVKHWLRPTSAFAA